MSFFVTEQTVVQSQEKIRIQGEHCYKSRNELALKVKAAYLDIVREILSLPSTKAENIFIL